MKLTHVIALAGVMSLCSPSAMARPVSYKGGWTVMQNNEADVSSLHVHYTTDPRASVGVRLEEHTYGDHWFVGGQYNRLLKRWNAPGAQANVYLKTGVGIASGEFNTGVDDDRLAGFARLSADWENRRWFIAGDLKAYSFEGRALTSQTARIGVAPYVAEFGGFHTWLMLQADWRQNEVSERGEKEFTTTPLVRFFKGTTLLELGYSSNDEPLVRFIKRF